MTTESFDDLLKFVLTDRTARVAYKENSVRRKLAVEFDSARHKKSLSVRELAKEMRTSLSQVQRLLHMEAGASLTLKTVFRAADVLDLNVLVHVLPAWTGTAKVIPLHTAWKTVHYTEVSSVPQSPAGKDILMANSVWDSTEKSDGQPNSKKAAFS